MKAKILLPFNFVYVGIALALLVFFLCHNSVVLDDGGPLEPGSGKEDRSFQYYFGVIINCFFQAEN